MERDDDDPHGEAEIFREYQDADWYGDALRVVADAALASSGLDVASTSKNLMFAATSTAALRALRTHAMAADDAATSKIPDRGSRSELAKELAKETGRSERTIYRYLNVFEEWGWTPTAQNCHRMTIVGDFNSKRGKKKGMPPDKRP